MAQGTTPLGGADNGHAVALEKTDPRVAELLSDIEKTRGEMSATVQEIEERLSPAHLKEQLLEQFHEAKEVIKQDLKDEWKDAKESVKIEVDEAKTAFRSATIGRVENMFATAVDTIKCNPIPSALTGIGLVWLVMNSRTPRRSSSAIRDRSREGFADFDRESSGATRRATEGVIDDVEEVASGFGEKAKETVGRIGEGVKETSHQLKDATIEAAGKTKRAVVKMAHGAKDMTREAAEGAKRLEHRFEDSVRENPMPYAAIAVAIGTAVGLAIPSTKIEDQYLGEARDRFVERAEEVAHEAIASIEPAPGSSTT